MYELFENFYNTDNFAEQRNYINKIVRDEDNYKIEITFIILIVIDNRLELE